MMFGSLASFELQHLLQSTLCVFVHVTRQTACGHVLTMRATKIKGGVGMGVECCLCSDEHVNTEYS